VLEVKVGELAHGGAAVTRVEGRVVFVEGALPGETVRAEVVHRRKDFWRAEVRAVLDPSPLRVEPPCPFYTQGCGGCQLQHLAYFEQLEQKRLVLTQQLRRARLAWPGERVEVLAMDEPWRYRIRGEFHVLHRGETTRLGFYRKRTYQTLPIDDCLIHVEPIVRALPAFEAAAADPKAARVQALQFTWAPGSNDLLWSPYPPGSADSGFAARAAPLVPDLNLNDDSIGMEDDGRQFRVRPEVFVQVNARQRVVLYQRALDLLELEGAERVVDAYAGIGMLSARLAGRSREVICLEESPYAVRLGELNMRLNECGNVLYQRGAVEDTLPRVAQPIDAVVVDPPRAGCADTAARAIRESGAKRIVYISCEPSTLARDLARLCDGGRYTLEAVALVDMFPQTYHIEAVVGLTRTA
jgi:23S rRNA (uracil1939-C5)-methyltransferase